MITYTGFDTDAPAPAGFVFLPVLRGVTEISALMRELAAYGGVIAGGYARFAVSQREHVPPATDVDVFPVSRLDSPAAVFEAIAGRISGVGFTVAHDNSVSVTYRNPRSREEARRSCSCRTDDELCDACKGLPENVLPSWRYHPRIQLIKPSEHITPAGGSVVELLSRFDFSVTRVALISESHAIADESFVADDQANRLIVRNVMCPITEIVRVAKYARKGYFLQPIEAVRILRAWETWTPDRRSRVEELLTANREELTQEQVDELEAMLRID